jgi:SAM-dependent methyltransferase
MLGRLKFNIAVLVEEILDQLPAYLWGSETTTFFDPAIGGGQFVAAVERRLRDAGHSDENISNRVFGYEDNQMRINFAINKYKLKGIYTARKFLEEEFNMKFDVILANPPYQGKAELHQRFFNKAVDLVKDGGIVSFIQPATPYFNKKENIRSNAKDMIENVKNYKTAVKIVDASVFEEAHVFTDLAVTILTKTQHNPGNLESFVSKAGNTLTDVPVDAVNMLDMSPVQYLSLVAKIKQMILANGSLQDLISTDIHVEKFYIQKVRGHIGKHDFYSIISNNDKYWSIKKEYDYGLRINPNQIDSLVSYLKSFVARFALAIYKFNGNNHMGELRSVPIVPFDRIWNDKMLCEYFDITDNEYQEILRCIPDYYSLGDNLG